MTRKSMVVCASALMLTASMASAAVHVWEDPNGWWTGHFSYDRSGGPKYTAQELSMDLFGTYTAGQRGIEHLFDTDIRHGEWGGGVGLNYFITREFGLSVDANATDNGGPFIDHVMASAIFRWPFESTGLAPYIFGGGGRATDPKWEWTAHAGVGVEYRFNPSTGVFVDGRYVWADDSVDRLMFRGGLRFVF